MLFRGFSIDNKRQNLLSTGTWHFGTNLIRNFLGINATFIFNPPTLWPMLSTWLFRLFSVVPSNRKITADKDHAIRVTKKCYVGRRDDSTKFNFRIKEEEAFQRRFRTSFSTMEATLGSVHWHRSTLRKE